MKAPAIQEIQS